MAAFDPFDEVKNPEKVLTIVHKFIQKNNITCAETIMQSDRVIENAYDFIEELCVAAGYAEEETYDDEEIDDITGLDYDEDNPAYGDDY